MKSGGVIIYDTVSQTKDIVLRVLKSSMKTSIFCFHLHVNLETCNMNILSIILHNHKHQVLSLDFRDHIGTSITLTASGTENRRI